MKTLLIIISSILCLVSYGQTTDTIYTRIPGVNAWQKIPINVTLKAASFNNGSPAAFKTYTASANISSGTAVVYLTDTGLIGGSAVFKNSVYSVLPIVNDATTNYMIGWSLSGYRRTLTVTVNKSTGFLAGLITYTSAANGVNVTLLVTGN